MHRRTFLQSGTAALLASGISSCRSTKKTELHIFTWSDYIHPKLVKKFEATHQCRVVIDTFDSNESMFAKIKAGASGYDIIVPSSYMAKSMSPQDLLRPLDLTKIPNRKHLDQEHLSKSLDPAMSYSVPYMSAPTCLAYRQSILGEVEPSYALFDHPKVKGRMTLLNDMREVIGAALVASGYSINSIQPEEIQQATELVLRWKKNASKFDNELYKTGIASGEFHLVHGYAGELLSVADEDEDIRVIIPQEGAAFTCDDLCIPASAPHPELAHAWIDFLCHPSHAAQNMEFIGYRAPNAAAYPLLSEDFRGNSVLFPAAELAAKCTPLDDLGADVAVWIAAWDQIKSA
jgi:spermidine/putrescine transport system substrate-binding protein